MKKRILSTVMMLLMLTVLVLEPLDVRAATVVSANGWTMEISSQSNSLTLDDPVVVSVKLNGNKDVTSIFGYLDYDKDVLGVSYCSTGSNNNNYNVIYTEGTQMVLLQSNNTMPWRPSGGDLFTVYFYVKKAVNETTISFQDVNVSNDYYYSYQRPTERVGSVSITITNTKSKKIILSTPDVSGSSYVTIPVSLAANDGWKMIEMKAEYDETKLQFSSVSLDNAINTKVAIGESTIGKSGSTTSVKTKFQLLPEMMYNEVIKNTGTLFYYTFRILPTSNTSTGSSSSGTTSGIVNPVNTTVTFSISDVTDVPPYTENIGQQPNNSFYLSSAHSIVTMNGGLRITGDVNGNGKIDLVDVLYIVQYYNKVRTLTSTEFSLADVDKNGVVNLVDAKKILKYYNGETSTF